MRTIARGLAALAFACAPLAAHAGDRAIIVIAEDEFFDRTEFSFLDAYSVIATGMSAGDCALASGTLDAYGALTACVRVADMRACIRAQHAPTDTNIEACTGTPVSLLP